MRPVLIIWLSIASITDVAVGQIPRTTSGQFQYYGEVVSENSAHSMERAKSFFNQPFLVHWDTVAHVEQPANLLLTGKGYINVRAKLHGVSVPSIIPVALHMSIEIMDGHYRYMINHFEVIDKEGKLQYHLEDKPETIKSIAYDQLLQNTHKRVSFVIGWLKKYMKGDE
ncbi:hypothetical protein A3860_28650 [Niastella vici]|uniref:DUF4468 domain-containing protein n=1 Tax=Niastella vici TaxID=1703345 RepID=A0A1V9FVR3_9BACT|nr:hypothetical protein [Niastella vici]OQP62336.1 hypothetical protein A3860_28650 [Niastella vici]